MRDLLALVTVAARLVPVDGPPATWFSIRHVGTLSLDDEGTLKFHRLVSDLRENEHFEHLEMPDIELSLKEFLIRETTDADTNRKKRALTFLHSLGREPTVQHLYFGITPLDLDIVVDLGFARFIPGRMIPQVVEALHAHRGHAEQNVYCEMHAAGGNWEKTYKRAERIVIEAVSLLRLHVRHSSGFRVQDQWQWDIGNWYVVESGGTFRVNFHRRPSPIPLQVSDGIWVDHCEQQGRDIDRLPKKLRARVMEALYWLDQAARATSPPVRVSHIFAAMEGLLIPGVGTGRKGEVLAVQSMVLELTFEGAFFTPHDTLDDYKLRSRIVHGAFDGAAVEIDDRVVSRLEYWATEMLDMYVRLALRTGAPNPTALVAALDQSEATERAVVWLEEQGEIGQDMVETSRWKSSPMTSSGRRNWLAASAWPRMQYWTGIALALYSRGQSQLLKRARATRRSP